MTYTSKTIYVDMDSGEILSKKTAEKQYLKIKTKKDAKTNYYQGKCHISYTVLCRKNPQTRLFSN